MPAIGQIALHVTDADCAEAFYQDALGLTRLYRFGELVFFDDEPHLIARMPDHELWMAFFKDPDGNQLALMEERR